MSPCSDGTDTLTSRPMTKAIPGSAVRGGHQTRWPSHQYLQAGTTGTNPSIAGPGNGYCSAGWQRHGTPSIALVCREGELRGPSDVVDGPSSIGSCPACEVFNLYRRHSAQRTTASAGRRPHLLLATTTMCGPAKSMPDTPHLSHDRLERGTRSQRVSNDFLLSRSTRCRRAGSMPLTISTSTAGTGRAPAIVEFDPQQCLGLQRKPAPANIDPIKHLLQIGMNENRACTGRQARDSHRADGLIPPLLLPQ